LFNKKYSVIFMAIVLMVTSVSQSQAANVIDIRSNSEADKTRIVVELDGPVQYQALYTSEPGVSICLLETGLRAAGKTINISDELVKTVVLKGVMGNIAEVSISLKGKSAFTVFPLESPDRIVIDVMPGVAIGTARLISTDNSETSTENLSKTPETPERSAIATAEKPIDNPAEELQGFAALFSLKNTDYALAQFCFNAFLLIALMVMGIGLWRVTRTSKKTIRTLKKNKHSTDMINKLQQGMREKDRNLGQRFARSVKPDISQKLQKRKRGEKHPQTVHQKQYEKVQKLAQLGMDRMEISQQSNVPIGEVNLILDLSKTESQAKAN